MAANPSIQLGTDGNWAIKEDNLLAYKKDGNRFFNKEFDFTRATSATRVNKQSLIETVAIDKPRIDYTDSLTSPSFLLEPQSTNYTTNSEQPSTWNSSSGMTITANATTSPEGTSNASLAVINTGSGNRYTTNEFVFSQGTGIQTVTGSYFIKYYNNQWVKLRSTFFTGSPANNNNSFFDIKNGVLGTVGANHTAKIEDYGNGWYRCSITFDINKDRDSRGQIHVQAMSSDNGSSASIGQGYYAFGSQGEELSYPTSYIPTNGSTVTRNQEVCNNSGSAQDFNSTEGVLYAEIAALADDGTSRRISLSDASTNDKVEIILQNTGRVDYQVKSGNSLQGGGFFNLTQTEYNKIAVKYKSNDLALWVNGSERSTDNSANTPIGLSELAFDNGAGGSDFYGKTKSLAVFKEALTDAELQELTT